MAFELKDTGVSVVSFWHGANRTAWSRNSQRPSKRWVSHATGTTM